MERIYNYILLILLVRLPLGASITPEEFRVSDSLTLEEFVDLARDNFEDDDMLARFYFFWISDQIGYDHELAREISNGRLDAYIFDQLHPEYVFDNRKSVCTGYANLLAYLLNESGIPAGVVHGYTKMEDAVTPDTFSLNHSWNRIFIKGRWILADPTWAASVNYDRQMLWFYYDVPPKVMIQTHFPEEDSWQLLDNPLSYQEFSRMPLVNPEFYLYGFGEIEPTFNTKNNTLVIRFSDSEEWKITVSTLNEEEIGFRKKVKNDTVQISIPLRTLDKHQIRLDAYRINYNEGYKYTQQGLAYITVRQQ